MAGRTLDKRTLARLGSTPLTCGHVLEALELVVGAAGGCGHG